MAGVKIRSFETLKVGDILDAGTVVQLPHYEGRLILKGGRFGGSSTVDGEIYSEDRAI